jgi:hypothetical protein
MPIDPDYVLLLGRIEGKLDSVLDQQGRVAKTLTDLDRRVRLLEAGWAKLLGASAAASVVVSWAYHLLAIEGQ